MNAPRRAPAFPLPVTPDDLVRHALAAYYRAVGDATAPQADPDPAGWSSPEDFIRDLADYFQLRLRCEVAAAGYPVEAKPDRYRCWSERPLARDRHIRDVDPELWAQMCIDRPELLLPTEPAGAGRSPAVKGHGWPALAPAVGPAAAALPASEAARDPRNASDITLHADPLLAARSPQELPVDNRRDNLGPDAEKIP